ncbi:MAG: thioesterase [Euryarchaeota archaeon]|nr:thioesterase [Euryarchaeota archaeon]
MGNERELSVQELHAPSSICFGCGPANEEGLRIRSFRTELGLEMEFKPSKEHQAFPGMVNGGIIGTLLDCHGNWTAAIALMDKSGASEPPCTVTASYSIKLRRPTPYGSTLRVTGEIASIEDDRANVRMALIAEDKICATGDGLFVAVKEGHPAFHRWS